MFPWSSRRRICRPKPKMRYNELGRTGMLVSHISLGGAPFSNIYGLFEETRSIALIHECLRSGINFLETGPWYGQGSSERTIGKALQGVPRHKYFIASKVGRYELDARRMFDFSAEKTEFGVNNTLKRLGLDYVDIIYVHDVSFAPNREIILKETLPTLQKAVDAGKVRFIGIADYDVGLMKTLVEESDVEISVILSYAKSTMLDNRFQNDVLYFKRRGIGVVNASPTGMGLLTNYGPPAWHPANRKIKDLCRRAGEFCSWNQVELARIATYYSINQPHVESHVCGFLSYVQLMDAVEVLRKGLTRLEERVYDELRTKYFCVSPQHWDGVEIPLHRQKLLQD